MKLTTLIKSAARDLGVDIRRYNPRNSEAARILAMLAHFEIDLVLDVGANEGQYARMLREAGYAGRILSFEPLSAAHAKLMQSKGTDSLWEVAPQAAVSDRTGEVEINISANSVSSSLQPMLEAHLQSAPGSHYVATERVPTIRLDDLKHEFVAAARHTFLKIDTQGHEGAVLAGGESMLRHVKGVQIEMSLVPLYEGQALYLETIQTLLAKGFELWGLLPGFMDASSGRQLQVDGIFFRG